nr:HAD family hydrolase [Roseibium sp. RKSG952]
MRLAAGLVLWVCPVTLVLADPLPSWNEGAAKSGIIAFVEQSVDPAHSAYVVPAERIAVFDQDGTLWAEKPYYFQIAYGMTQIKQRAAEDPDFGKGNPVLKAAIEGDAETIAADGMKGFLELMVGAQEGMSVSDFKESVRQWLAIAVHPDTGEPYEQMVYQPMLELLSYMRDNGFKTYIVSGGGINFIRAYAQTVYGIPPEQVIGSSLKSEFEIRDDFANVYMLPEVFFDDNHSGKPVGIDLHIGRRPVFAVGNSDGDQQMLEYTTLGERPAFAILVHHTDSEREWAYDRNSDVGHLDTALKAAKQYGWTVIDMKSDWRTVFPYQLDGK